jgi:hypothetical protein
LWKLVLTGAAGLGKTNLNRPHRRIEALAAVVSAKDGVESCLTVDKRDVYDA